MNGYILYKPFGYFEFLLYLSGSKALNIQDIKEYKKRKVIFMASFDEPTSIISLIGGLVLVPLGLIPLLSKWGIIGWGLPGFLTGLLQGILLYVIAAGGAWLLIDGFLEDDMWRVITLGIAILVLILAIIPILPYQEVF